MTTKATKTIKVNKPISEQFKKAIDAKQEWKNAVKSGQVKALKDKGKRFL